MTAITSRRKPASGDAEQPHIEQLRAELAETRAALRLTARIAAQAAAKCGHGQWTDFGKLLTEQFAISHEDATAFLAILSGDKP